MRYSVWDVRREVICWVEADSPQAALKVWGEQHHANVGAVRCYIEGEEDTGPNFWVYYDNELGVTVEPYNDGPQELDWRGFTPLGAGWVRRCVPDVCMIWLGRDGKWYYMAHDNIMERSVPLCDNRGSATSGMAYAKMCTRIECSVPLMCAAAVLMDTQRPWAWEEKERAWVCPHDSGLKIKQAANPLRWIWEWKPEPDEPETFTGPPVFGLLTAKNDFAWWIKQRMGK